MKKDLKISKEYQKPVLTDMTDYELRHTDGGGFIIAVSVLLGGAIIVAGLYVVVVNSLTFYNVATTVDRDVK